VGGGGTYCALGTKPAPGKVLSKTDLCGETPWGEGIGGGKQVGRPREKKNLEQKQPLKRPRGGGRESSTAKTKKLKGQGETTPR